MKLNIGIWESLMYLNRRKVNCSIEIDDLIRFDCWTGYVLLELKLLNKLELFKPSFFLLLFYKFIGWIIENGLLSSNWLLPIWLFNFEGETDMNFLSSVENLRLSESSFFLLKASVGVIGGFLNLLSTLEFKGLTWTIWFLCSLKASF